jgi:phospholipid/cholesterol/gamma-HCH transport system ATP-binding protein
MDLDLIDKDNNHRRRPFISLRAVEKSFADKRVLRGIDLEVMEGETIVVLGGSGEGKSVLLRHINGLERPDAGEVWVDGKRLNALSEDELFPIRREVAMVFQLGALFDSLTVFGNVSYPIREHGERDEELIGKRVHEVLDMVELHKDVDKLFPAELSGGMKKRVALARALALEPKAVLYDEPTTGLDPIVTHKINQMIRNLQTRLGFTSVVVTHDLRSAFMVGDRFALLDQGRIRFSGTAAEVRSTSDELMREFVETAL